MNLINTKNYNGNPVIYQHGPLIENILIGNEMVLNKFLSSHNRVAVMRLELKFPENYSGNFDVISRFFASLCCRVKSDLVRKTKTKGRNIDSDVGYIWVKELSGDHGWHYHVALLLNHDVYNCFGKINSNNPNMFNRILFSWASALALSGNDTKGLVHIPDKAVYKLDRNLGSYEDDVKAVMFRLSYFAKLYTKPYGGVCRMRFYGTSNRQ